jgi:hypothetical protein
MTGTTTPKASGQPGRHPARRRTRATPAMPDSGNAAPDTAGTARRHTCRAAAAPLTAKPHKPCSSPPKSRPAAYARRPAAGPGRAPRRAQRQSAQTRQVRVELPEEPPPLTPDAALALLRLLLKAHATRTGEELSPTAADHRARPAAGTERKG